MNFSCEESGAVCGLKYFLLFIVVSFFPVTVNTREKVYQDIELRVKKRCLNNTAILHITALANKKKNEGVQSGCLSFRQCASLLLNRFDIDFFIWPRLLRTVPTN